MIPALFPTIAIATNSLLPSDIALKIAVLSAQFVGVYAAFTPTNCAERTAFFKAISEGQMDFVAIAVVGNKDGIKQGEGDYCAPCAVCRQVMAEFCDLDTFKVIMAKDINDYKEYTLGELLPLAFTGKALDK